MFKCFITDEHGECIVDEVVAKICTKRRTSVFSKYCCVMFRSIEDGIQLLHVTVFSFESLLLKGILTVSCISIIFTNIFSGLRVIGRHLFKLDTLRVAIPSGLYVIQNNLLFLALTNLDAATYQVTYQLKILTTAAFSWWMLGRHISTQRIVSLFVLVIGVSLVQV